MPCQLLNRQPAHHLQRRGGRAAAARQPGAATTLPVPCSPDRRFARAAVLTDTMALARHTKVLDKELRALRKEAAQTQAALLQLSSAGRKQGVTSPLGPFTSFPPQL